MTRTAYLRVYLPIERFTRGEQRSWASRSDPDEASEPAPVLLEGARRGWTSGVVEGAFVRRYDGRTFVSPWRLRLRMLAAILTLRDRLPGGAADAFVPERVAQAAAAELASLGERLPLVLHSNWYVPLHWFWAFSDRDRVLCESAAGLRIRYDTALADARTRLRRAEAVLDGSVVDAAEAVRELLGWLDEVSGDGLLELDYSSVALGFDPDGLLADHSARDVQDCLDALASGDEAGAVAAFEGVTARWAAMRAVEAVN